ncbi:hypothetical protein GOBAR_DD01222 [Gossypium barbadense]|nr:hypothetical protein GOBAR_DD01222 [Gossypium barbadense]
MEVLSIVKKKNATKKIDVEPTQWEHRLGRDVCYNTRLLEAMKPFMDTFLGNATDEDQEEEARDEENDEATEDDDFAPYHDNFQGALMSLQPSTGAPYHLGVERPTRMSLKRSVIKDKGKRIVGSSEGPCGDSQ